MKKILLFVCLCTCSLLLSAQNYEPFLFGKTYKYLNPKDSIIITQKIDILNQLKFETIKSISYEK